MSGTHKAVVLKAVGQPLTIETLPIPEAVLGSATVRVLATALSPNSKETFAGTFISVPLRTPVTPSAAAIGRVHSVGADATSLKPGQLVFTDFWTSSRDNPDDQILAGYLGGIPALETVWQHGTFAEYANIPLERVFVLDEKLLCDKLGYTPADLVHLGNLNIALAGVLDINVLPGETVVVAPATGSYGGAAVHASIAIGARVIACGRNAKTLARMEETFRSSGRLEIVQMTGEVEADTKAIKNAAGGVGADKFIDFSPPQAAESKHIVSCISALRHGARAVLMGGVFGSVSIPYFHMMLNNIKLEGRFMFERHHVEQSLKMLASGHLVLGDRPNSGVKAYAFKLSDIDRAVEKAAAIRGWGKFVSLEP